MRSFRAPHAWRNQLPIVLVPTKYYRTPASEYRKARISTVIWPNHASGGDAAGLPSHPNRGEYDQHRARHSNARRGVRSARHHPRPASVGEDHEPIEIAEFWRQIEYDRFALHWEAHGLHYGLLKLIDNWLDQSHVVVANGLRSVGPEARRRYANLQVIRITASPAVLAERLAMRGRKGNKAQKERIARSGTIDVDLNDALTIDNSGNFISTGNQFIETVLSELPADTHIEHYAGRGNDA